MTFLEMQTYVRDLLGEPSPQFWSAAQIKSFINRSYLQVFLKMVQMNRGHFATTTTLSYVANTELYTLPSGNHKILMLERSDTTPKTPLLPIALSQKHIYDRDTAPPPPGQERYYFLGNKVGIVPAPTSAITNAVTVYYVPVPTLLSADGDVFPGEVTDALQEVIAMGAIVRALLRDRAKIEPWVYRLKEFNDDLIDDSQERQYQEPQMTLDTQADW